MRLLDALEAELKVAWVERRIEGETPLFATEAERAEVRRRVEAEESHG